MSPAAISLWHALMMTSNKAMWPAEFAVSSAVLQNRARCSKNTFYIARNQLVNLQRISFREQEGRRPTIYHIIPFVPELLGQECTPQPRAAPASEEEIALQSKYTLICEQIDWNEIEKPWRHTLKEALRRMVRNQSTQIRGERLPRTQVISQLKRLDTDAVKLALDRLNAADKDIANPVAYLMTCLYNAPDELDAMLGIECERDLPHLTQRYRR